MTTDEALANDDAEALWWEIFDTDDMSVIIGAIKVWGRSEVAL